MGTTSEPTTATTTAIPTDPADLELEEKDDEETFTCENCGEDDLSLDDAHTVNDTQWCESCWDNYGRTCEGCDGTFHYNDVRYDRRDDPYCERCEDRGRGHWREANFDGESIHDHDTDIFEILPVSLNERTLYFGFELELNTRDEDDRWNAARLFLKDYPGQGIVKHDGSIGDGDSGIELVSVPLCFGDACKLLHDVCSNERLSSLTFADPSCGLHVHASRAPLSDATILRLARFINNPVNAPFLELLAGRKLIGSGWARVDPTLSWRALYNTNPTWTCRSRIMFPDRYMALNLSNRETLEFRLFASTTDPDRAQSAIEACAALIDFSTVAARDLRTASCHNAFRSFVTASNARYPTLAAFLAKQFAATTAAA